MAQPPLQDLVSGVDFTGLPGFDGSILNQSLATQVPSSGAVNTEGIGFNFITYDTALNVPNVPDPVGQNQRRWKRYIWIRVPFAGTTDSTIILYSWNDNIASDPTMFKWVTTRSNIALIQSNITDLQNELAVTTDTANTALAVASSASTLATTANTNATNASSQAVTAQTTATAAQTSATAANTLATTANTTANAANTLANNALAAANADKLVTQITPGLAGQRIRTNSLGVANEYFSLSNTIATMAEIQANTTAGDTVNNGSFQDRTLNTKVVDPGSIITTFVGNAFVLTKGTYRIRVVAPMVAASVKHCARLYNATDAVQVMQGTNALTSTPSLIEGVFSTDGTKAYKIQTWTNTTAAGGTANSFGLSEIYTVVNIELVG